MRRALQIILLAAVLVTVSAAVAGGAQAEALRGQARIAIFLPRAYQVFQRDGAGTGAIVVRGSGSGFPGPVQVRWGTRPWRTVARKPNGSFAVILDRQAAGQAALVVRSARRHQVLAVREYIGVGDIYVIAGQSNACGRSSYRFECNDPELRAAAFANDDHWRLLTDPVDLADGQVDRVSSDPSAGGSVWPLVAQGLMGAARVPAAFIPCAHIGTSIDEWRRPSRIDGTTLYGSMVRRVRAAGGEVRAVLYWQGEADARAHMSTSAYQARLRQLARDVARDVGAPLVVAQIGDYGLTHDQAGVDAVRLAQSQSWGQPNLRAGPVLYDIDLGGVVHFSTPDDVEAAAHRWTAAILRSVLRLDAGRTPRFRNAVASADGREIVITAYSGIHPSADLGGLIVRAADQLVPIDSAVADGGATIRLVLAEPQEGPLTVSLGEGRSAAGASVPTDLSDRRLPMLPFVRQPVFTLEQ